MRGAGHSIADARARFRSMRAASARVEKLEAAGGYSPGRQAALNPEKSMPSHCVTEARYSHAPFLALTCHTFSCPDHSASASIEAASCRLSCPDSILTTSRTASSLGIGVDLHSYSFRKPGSESPFLTPRARRVLDRGRRLSRSSPIHYIGFNRGGIVQIELPG